MNTATRKRLEALESRKSAESIEVLDPAEMKRAKDYIRWEGVVLSGDGAAIALKSYWQGIDHVVQWLNKLSKAARLEVFEKYRSLNEYDADKLTDDEVLQEALRGLGGGSALTVWNNGIFRVTFSNPALGPRYWQRIAERAQALCQERDTILVPMTFNEMHQIIEYINIGVFKVHTLPPQRRYGHESCIGLDYSIAGASYNSPESKSLYKFWWHITDALDTVLWQFRLRDPDAGLFDTTEKVTEFLEWALSYESEDEPCDESANESSG